MKNDKSKSASKRALLKKLGTASVAIAATQLPDKWVAPMVELVVLPAHAQATNPAPDCGLEGAQKSNPGECCKDMDKTVPVYLEECCVNPAVDASGALVKNAAGEYLCCDLLDPDSPEYAKYCCSNPSKVKDSNGDPKCCEGADLDPVYCCIKSEVTYASSIERTRTNWSTIPNTPQTATVSLEALPRWDPKDGPLGRVVFNLTGEIDSLGTFENGDNAAVTATFEAAAKLDITAPGGVAFHARPSITVQQELEPADSGLPNHSGPDFWEPDPIGATKSESFEVTDPDILAQVYTGAGQDVSVDVTAMGESKFTGSGNAAAFINTFASASISITYFCDSSKV